MLRLTIEEYDEAVTKMARALAEFPYLRTNAGRAIMALEALGEVFDVATPREPGALANDDTDAIIAGYWADADPEDAFANALRTWSQGQIP